MKNTRNSPRRDFIVSLAEGMTVSATFVKLAADGPHAVLRIGPSRLRVFGQLHLDDVSGVDKREKQRRLLSLRKGDRLNVSIVSLTPHIRLCSRYVRPRPDVHRPAGRKGQK